jgi:hypothetical protein
MFVSFSGSPERFITFYSRVTLSNKEKVLLTNSMSKFMGDELC